MAYIEEKCGGHLFALGGVSLGGQIVMELITRKAEYNPECHHRRKPVFSAAGHGALLYGCYPVRQQVYVQ